MTADQHSLYKIYDELLSRLIADKEILPATSKRSAVIEPSPVRAAIDEGDYAYTDEEAKEGLKIQIAAELEKLKSDPETTHVPTEQSIAAHTLQGDIEDDVFQTILRHIKKRHKGVTASKLHDAIKDYNYSKLSAEMPLKIYRGQVEGDPETEGFSGLYSSDTPMVFVSTEPSVAASYARQLKNEEAGDRTPSNFGDWVYEILTEGLDPSLYKKDETASGSELRYGPQYYYEGTIPQQDVDIVDSAGNLRKVPRIRRVRYPSDFRVKKLIRPLPTQIERRF